MAATATRRRPSRVTSLAILAAGCLLLYVSLPNLGKALFAATADGKPGTFTAVRLECVSHPGHESCGWSGTFRSRDGAVWHTRVTLSSSGRGSLYNGQQVKAVDMGTPGRVFRPGGSQEWILTVVLLLAGYGLLALFAKRHLMPPSRPRRHTSNRVDLLHRPAGSTGSGPSARQDHAEI